MPMLRVLDYSLLLALITIIVFWRITTDDFTYWDDLGTIHHNPRLNPPTVQNLLWYWGHSELGLYIPVTYTVWGVLAAEARLDEPDEFGIALDPSPFHEASLIVHVGSVLLVFAILRRGGGGGGGGFVGGLLVVIYSLQTAAGGGGVGVVGVLFVVFLAV